MLDENCQKGKICVDVVFLLLWEMICWRIELSELDSLDCKVTGKFTIENTKKEIVEHEVNTESTCE